MTSRNPFLADRPFRWLFDLRKQMIERVKEPAHRSKTLPILRDILREMEYVYTGHNMKLKIGMPCAILVDSQVNEHGLIVHAKGIIEAIDEAGFIMVRTRYGILTPYAEKEIKVLWNPDWEKFV
ncbi:MAG: hypothetical protein WC477_07605 [Patescibacteria group bacterium]